MFATLAHLGVQNRRSGTVCLTSICDTTYNMHIHTHTHTLCSRMIVLQSLRRCTLFSQQRTAPDLLTWEKSDNFNLPSNCFQYALVVSCTSFRLLSCILKSSAMARSGVEATSSDKARV